MESVGAFLRINRGNHYVGAYAKNPRVPNPTHPDEDYADKWSKDRRLETHFLQWHSQAVQDFETLPALMDPVALKAATKRSFQVDLRDDHLRTLGLALGSRVGLRLQMGRSPSLLRFVERCVVPYLYGYSYSVKHGAPPFGELEHGELGSLQDLASLLRVEDLDLAFRYCTLAATTRRRANRRPCPCGSGRRLGRCHNRKVNALRKGVGRLVLVSEMRTIVGAFREQSRRKRSAAAREEAAATRPRLLELIREMRRPTMLPPWVRPIGHVLQQGPA